MSDYIVQLKDDKGSKQYPITLARCVVADDGSLFGNKLNELQGRLDNLKTLDNISLTDGEGNIPFRTITIDGKSYKIIGESGTITIPSGNYDDTNIRNLISQKQDKLVSGTNIKNLAVGETLYSILGSGQLDIKTIGGESIFGTGDISGGVEYRTLLFEGDTIPDGYDSIEEYNAETAEKIYNNSAIPILMIEENCLLYPSTINQYYDQGSDGIENDGVILGFNQWITDYFSNPNPGISMTKYILLAPNGITMDLGYPKVVDVNSLTYNLDKISSNVLDINHSEVIEYFDAINSVNTFRHQLAGFSIPSPTAYVIPTTNLATNCIVNNFTIVSETEFCIEYDFGEYRYSRTYTINGSNATYEEEEISLGGGAGEGAYIGPEQPEDNSRVNLWIDTDEGEEINGVIIGGDGYLGDILIDDEMSDTSTNAVQNRVIKEYIDRRIEEELGNIKALLDQINGNA